MQRLALLAFALLGAAPPPDPRPNIVLILADDLGYECLGANGGTSYQTPNLDRLAAGGVRFTSAFAQPLCTPTRAQLLTGLSNVRNYTRFAELDPAAATFPQLLRKAGYATGIAGKWQLGRDPGLPGRFGFDEACLWQHTRRPPRYANPGLEIDGVERDYKNGEYGPDLVNAWALDFLKRRKDDPFFLFYAMMLTHAPFQPTPDSPDWDPKAKGEKVNDHPKHFAGMVAYMDKLIGTVVARLDELGIRERTLILFVGDNGTLGTITSQLDGKPYKGGKGQANRAGMHVPLLVNRPGAAPAGKVCDDLVDSTDFFPTICAAAGVAVPEGLDGRDFLAGGKPREWIYCWYSRDGGPKAQHESAFDRSRKLTRAGALFDLDADPWERSPLPPNADPAARKRLQAALDLYAGARTR